MGISFLIFPNLCSILYKLYNKLQQQCGDAESQLSICKVVVQTICPASRIRSSAMGGIICSLKRFRRSWSHARVVQGKVQIILKTKVEKRQPKSPPLGLRNQQDQNRCLLSHHFSLDIMHKARIPVLLSFCAQISHYSLCVLGIKAEKTRKSPERNK